MPRPRRIPAPAANQASRATRTRHSISMLGRLMIAIALSLMTASEVVAQQCPNWDAARQPFFGDVHVHSARSFDSYVFETRNGPRDAYRFAMGAPIGLPPLDAFGDPTRSYRLRMPLDFAAVTDHAEMLGETSLCTVEGLAAAACNVFEAGSFGGLAALFGSQFRDADPQRRPICGAEGQLCLASAVGVWDDTRLAANEFDDPNGNCDFTAFIGYEWTGSPGGNNLHRNVLFRNGSVPTLPLSYVEVQDPKNLWLSLRAQCEAVGNGCEALTIPHNSNQSGGQAFLTTESDGSPLTFETAQLRNEMEPLVELIQHKGDSECRLGVGTTDEQCEFEKIPGSTVADDTPLSYVRNVLKAGLALDAQLGVNPFALGLIGSSDTHNATPGATQENDFPGHVGNLDSDSAARLDSGSILQNPGGLMVLWSEENSRDALFDAMKRRESYATSGTRPRLRVFAGFDLPTGLCSRSDLVAQGYASGVPMGGRLATGPTDGAPRFVVQASQDPGSPGFPGTTLAEIQIIKGWIDDRGTTFESVVSIAGGPPASSAVDLLTCQPDGSGATDLCAEWQDPGFDPSEHAFYYVRLLESPTCRWSTQLCRDQGVDCSGAPPTGFEACCDGSVPDTIQERATSSPIWVRPVPEPSFGLVLVFGCGGIVAGGRFAKRRSKNP